MGESSDDIGLTLRTQREAAGRTLRDVADVTKLGVRTLEALERNQIERLPPGIFRRSVVRSYAKAIGLDPEQTLQAFLARHPDNLPPPGRQTGPVAEVAPKAPRVPPETVAAIAVAVAVVALLLLVGCLLWPESAPPTRGAAAPADLAATGHDPPRTS